MVDHARGHTKYGEMANFLPRDLDDLADEVAVSMLSKHQRPDLLGPFSSMPGSTYDRDIEEFKEQ